MPVPVAVRSQSRTFSARAFMNSETVRTRSRSHRHSPLHENSPRAEDVLGEPSKRGLLPAATAPPNPLCDRNSAENRSLQGLFLQTVRTCWIGYG